MAFSRVANMRTAKRQRTGDASDTYLSGQPLPSGGDDDDDPSALLDDCSARFEDALEDAARIQQEQLRGMLEQIVAQKLAEQPDRAFLDRLLGYMSVRSGVRAETLAYDTSRLDAARDRALTQLRLVDTLKRQQRILHALSVERAQMRVVGEDDNGSEVAARQKKVERLKNVFAAVPSLDAVRHAFKNIHQATKVATALRQLFDTRRDGVALALDTKQFNDNGANEKVFKNAEIYLRSRFMQMTYAKTSAEDSVRLSTVCIAALDAILIDSLQVGLYPFTEHDERFAADTTPADVRVLVALVHRLVDAILDIQKIKPAWLRDDAVTMRTALRSLVWQGFLSTGSIAREMPVRTRFVLTQLGLYVEADVKNVTVDVDGGEAMENEAETETVGTVKEKQRPGDGDGDGDGEQSDTDASMLSRARYLRGSEALSDMRGNDDATIARAFGWLCEHAIVNGGASRLVHILENSTRAVLDMDMENMPSVNTAILTVLTDETQSLLFEYENETALATAFAAQTLHYLVRPLASLFVSEWMREVNNPYPTSLSTDFGRDLTTTLLFTDYKKTPVDVVRPAKYIAPARAYAERTDSTTGWRAITTALRDLNEAVFGADDGVPTIAPIELTNASVEAITSLANALTSMPDTRAEYRLQAFPLAYALDAEKALRAHLEQAEVDLAEAKRRARGLAPIAHSARHTETAAFHQLAVNISQAEAQLASHKDALQTLLEQPIPRERTLESAIRDAYDLARQYLPGWHALTGDVRELIFAEPTEVADAFAGLVAERHRQHSVLQGASGEYQQIPQYTRVRLREQDFMARLRQYSPQAWGGNRHGGRTFAWM